MLSVYRIGLSPRAALLVARTKLVIHTAIFLMSAVLVFLLLQVVIDVSRPISDSPQQAQDVINIFLLHNIVIPLLLVNLFLCCCTLFHVFARMQTSVRWLYIDTFYLNTAGLLVRVFFSVFMLVIVFTPHSYFISHTRVLHI